MNLDFWRSKMKELLDEELFLHSEGVAGAARQLACSYGADGDKACLAGYLHDYGKRYSAKELARLAAQMQVKIDPVSLKEPRLLHAPVGALLLKRDLGLDDEDILTAVRFHTTGVPGMSLLDKILYLADYIEPGRDYEGVSEIRKLAENSLEQALLAAVDNTIRSVLRRGLLLHPDSVRFRNSILGLEYNE